MKRLSKEQKKRIEEWSEVLKDDQDYHFYCILKILTYKLARTRKCISEGLWRDRKDAEREIREVEILLTNVTEEKHQKDARKKLEKKYGPLFLPKTKKKTRKTKDDQSIIDELFRSKWDDFPEKKKEKAYDEFLKAMDFAKMESRLDMEKAFYLLNKNIRKWWD